MTQWINENCGKHDSFDIEIKTEIDEYPDTSWLGEFSNIWEIGAIDRGRTGHYTLNSYRYFIPSSGCENFDKKWDRAKKAKYMKMALQDHLYTENLNDGRIWFKFITVTASLYGIELGFDCIGGIDSDYSIKKCVKDHGMVESAVAIAKEKLKKLQEVSV